MKARFPYVTQSGKMLTSGLTSHVCTVIPRANTHTHAHTHTHTRTHTHAHTHMHAHVHTCTREHTRARAHTCARTRTRTHTRTHALRKSGSKLDSCTISMSTIERNIKGIFDLRISLHYLLQPNVNLH